ncbi:EF-hand 1, calcium-binding site-containing protein [Tanacetum coccineum]
MSHRSCVQGLSNVAEELGLTVAWEHEQFSRLRVTAATLSGHSAPPDLLESTGGLFDNREFVNEATVVKSVKVVAESLARHIYGQQGKNINILADNSSLAVNPSYIRSWLDLMSRTPRVAPFLSRDSAFIMALKKVLTMEFYYFLFFLRNSRSHLLETFTSLKQDLLLLLSFIPVGSNIWFKLYGPPSDRDVDLIGSECPFSSSYYFLSKIYSPKLTRCVKTIRTCQPQASNGGATSPSRGASKADGMHFTVISKLIRSFDVYAWMMFSKSTYVDDCAIVTSLVNSLQLHAFVEYETIELT